MSTKLTARNKQSRDIGFSLPEILVAMVVGGVILAAAFPAISIVKSARLRGAAAEYASLLQNARLEAVQNDTYYSVVITAGPPVQAFIDLQGTGVFANGDPLVAMPTSVTQQTYASNPPALTNLESQALASASDPSLDTTDNPTFGPRGLPCKPVTSGSYTTCPAFSGVVSGTSYITFFQDGTADGTWAAVVVNPSGRIRSFSYSGNGPWVASR